MVIHAISTIYIMHVIHISKEAIHDSKGNCNSLLYFLLINWLKEKVYYVSLISWALILSMEKKIITF